MTTLTEKIAHYTNELSNLASRARAVNYKNKLPRLPKKPSLVTLIGFEKRLSNWKSTLIRLESERYSHTIKNDPSVLMSYINN